MKPETVVKTYDNKVKPRVKQIRDCSVLDPRYLDSSADKTVFLMTKRLKQEFEFLKLRGEVYGLFCR